MSVVRYKVKIWSFSRHLHVHKSDLTCLLSGTMVTLRDMSVVRYNGEKESNEHKFFLQKSILL